MKLEQYLLFQAIYEEFKGKIKPEDICRVEVIEEGKVLTKDLGGNCSTKDFKNEIISKLKV